MAKFDGVLLCSDYDNTIVDTAAVMRGEIEESLPGERTIKALEYFMANGGRFAVATGRALAAFASHAKNVPSNTPAILYNGGALYDFATKTLLESDYLNDKALERVQVVLERWSGIGAEAYNDSLDIPTIHPNAVTLRHQKMANTGSKEYEKLTDVPMPVGKILLEGDRDLLQQAHDYLHAQPWSGEYEVIFSGINLLEITAKGANKGNMVRRLARRLEIPMDHVYCIGDETNDISMLTIAREGFAPANCVQAVKDCGATIVSDKNHDALADVIEILDRYY